MVEVRLRQPVSAFFTAVIGLGSTFSVSARAVGTAAALTQTGTTVIPGTTDPGTVISGTTITGTTDPGTTSTTSSTTTFTTTVGGGPALLFAKSTTACDALHISGSNNVFNGAFWSNAGVNESGSNYGAPPTGDAVLYYGTTDVPKCLTWKPTWTSVQYHAPIDWPVPPPTLVCSDGSSGTSCPTGAYATSVNGVPCTYMGDKYTVKTQLAAGLYCTSNSLTVNQAGLTALNVGYVAPSIGWSSGTDRLTGYTGASGTDPNMYAQYGGLLFFAYGSSGINASGSGNSFTGAVFAPLGNVQLSGGSSLAYCGGVLTNACGFFEGLTVQLSGSDGNWTGLGPPIGGTSTTTTQTITTTTTVVGTTDPGTTIPDVTVPGTTDPGSTSTSTITVGTSIGLGE
jgi:hypothetical protein